MMAGKMDDDTPRSRNRNRTAVTMMVSLTELLSTCVDAARRGCDVIRSVHSKRSASSLSKDDPGGNNNFAVKYKEDDDPRSAVTEADVAAQEVIVGSLRRTWDDEGTGSRLRIVGEEDGDDDAEGGDGDEGEAQPLLSRDLLDPTSSFSPPDGDVTTPSTLPDSVPFDSITIFVDPVDGTREFVEGRLGNVQCLVGVAINGRAVAGAVGLPFPKSNTTDDGAYSGTIPPPVVVYGLVGRGVGHWKAADEDGEGAGVAIPGHMSNPGTSPADVADEIVISTGDSSSSFLTSERRCAECAVTTVGSHLPTPLKTKHLMAGGSGNKLLLVSMGMVDVALIHDKTCLWDTCAPEAVLVASGGTVTDAFGSPLVHSVGGENGAKGDPEPVADGHRNALGVIASRCGKGGVVGKIHEETCRLMRCDDDVALRLLEPWGLMGSPAGDDDVTDEPHPLPPQAIDVARSLDGAPLDVRWIEDRILASCDDTTRMTRDLWRLEGYDVPEEEAVRGLMSNGCRLHLHWKRINADYGGDPPPQDASSSSPPTPPMPPRSAFYKRIVMGDLPHARLKLRTMPRKLERDVRSYGVESSFYDSVACRRLIEDAHVHVPRAYDADLRPSPNHPIEGKFALLLEDFNECEGWRQEWLLGERSALAALESFARMHAYFWDGSNFWIAEGSSADDARRKLTSAVWPSGGYVQPSLQTDGQTAQVASGWEVHLPKFAQHEIFTSAPELEGVDLDGLGRRLEAVAAEMGREAHPFCDKSGRADGFRKWRTLTHGDPKQANIFVREAAAKRVMPPGMAICDDDDDCEEGDGDGKKLDVGLIDFQWCGFGLAATDVAHNITAALLPECLSVDGSREDALLDHYYSHLCRSLVEFGVADTVRRVEEELFPRSVLQSQYETAVLDMCRIVFAYSWRRFRHEDVPSVESANRNSYNKSVPTVVWLVARCDALLRKRGVVVS